MHHILLLDLLVVTPYSSLFSILFLVKNTYGVKEGRSCDGKGLFVFAHAVAYGMKNPPGLKEDKCSGIL